MSSINNISFGGNLRLNIFRVLILIFALVYIGRLAHLQIVKGSIYRLESQAQAVKEEIVEPFRGNIYDRNGKLIVHNEPSYTVAITISGFSKDTASQILLASLLDIDTSEINKQLKKYAKESRYKPIKMFKDVGIEKAALVEEYSDMLIDVQIVVESKRLYHDNITMSHSLGYARQISENELEQLKKDGYRPGDLIGKTGIEKYYENYLKGVKGIKYVAVNPLGKKISSFNGGQDDKLVSNGYDLYLTIDRRLQETAESLLADKRGAVVAIDPRDGGILAIASKPDFNLLDFAGKVSPEVYNRLSNDPGKPLYSRATMSAYPPGSTWKMLVGLAGLQEGKINTNSTLSCPGSFQYGGRSYGCHGAHGSVNVRRAIQASCNVFFYRLALNLGMHNIQKYAQMFGFGDVTGVDIAEEKKGFFPTVKWLQKKYGKGAERGGRIVNYGIGQGEINVTPLQMANYVATIANKGVMHQPHILHSYYNNITNRQEYPKFFTKVLPIDKSNFDIIQDGMYDVVNVPGGTANNAKIIGKNVCGKTGTAQNPHGRDHSWFVCFAPKENPTIAIAVIVENAGFGSTVAAPIARDVLFKYFYPDSIVKPPTADTLSFAD